MSKTTIIGLGLVGNSIGMGLRRAAVPGQASEVVGFDPERSREEMALRKYFSADSIAPDLERAVRGADLVIISTPMSAMREVLEAIGPFLDEEAIVTDTLSSKEQVIAWANELLGPRISFVGGHPLSKSVDLETADDDGAPSADLFLKAPYCIMPSTRARNEALSRVIMLAETLGAQPLFIDPHEHDSLFAAVSQLPVVAGAALLGIVSESPSWSDLGSLASGQFASATAPISADAEALGDALVNNRRHLVQWVDRYLLAVQDLRDLLASGDRETLMATIAALANARKTWATPGDVTEARLRAELREAITDTRMTSNLMGGYVTKRFFGKKEK